MDCCDAVEVGASGMVYADAFTLQDPVRGNKGDAAIVLYQERTMVSGRFSGDAGGAGVGGGGGGTEEDGVGEEAEAEEGQL